MRFIITAHPAGGEPKAEDSGDMSDRLFEAYMKYNEELYSAGVLVASEGLTPGTPGALIVTSGGRRKVVDGPFAESKELVGGLYIIDVATLEEAKAWALRCPTGMSSADVLEVRQLTEMGDIPAPYLALAQQVAPTWTASVTGPRPKRR